MGMLRPGPPAGRGRAEEEALSMKFWVPFTLGLITYYLLGRLAIHEGINIFATSLVLVGGHFLYGWMAKKPGS